jgi:pectin methylesterase-like acyl-CoA thioesterase
VLTGVERVEIGGTGFLLVDKTGGNGAYTTIQAAINAAEAGDTILIAPGNYDEDGRADTSNIYLSDWKSTRTI